MTNQIPELGGMGALPHPLDPREVRFAFAAPIAPALPARMTQLFPYVPKVKNQGNQGSCTGQATTGAAETLAAIQGIPFEGSEAYTYFMARQLSGLDTNQDTGAYVNRAADVAAQGICSEAMMPYNPADFRTAPNEAAKADALKNDYVLRHEPILQGDKVLQVKQALANGSPVLAGFAVHRSFARTPGRHGLMPLDQDGLQGYHLVYLVGYSDSRMTTGAPNGYFFAVNSWDESWTPTLADGDARPGWFLVPYEAIDTLFFELRALVIQRVEPPTPPPPVRDLIDREAAIAAIRALPGV